MFVNRWGTALNGTAYGQSVMRGILEKYLERIPRDAAGLAARVFPIHSKRLAIDPYFSSGKPIVRDRGITAAVLCGRNRSGENLAQIETDYGISENELKQPLN